MLGRGSFEMLSSCMPQDIETETVSQLLQCDGLVISSPDQPFLALLLEV